MSRVLARARSDTTSGASQLLDSVIGDLLECIKGEGPGPSSGELAEFALGLWRARGSMAPVFHLSNRLLITAAEPITNRLALEEDLSRMRCAERGSIPLISSACRRMLRGTRFLVISRSSAVIKSLTAMAADRRIEATVMESLPGGEGSMTARELSDGGVRVTLVSDSMVNEEAGRCDAGLSGADSLSPGGALNKIGTRSMAHACTEAGIPCHVLAGVSKLLPFTPSDMLRDERNIDGLTRASQVFELTPLHLFDLWISESGGLPAMEAAQRSASVAISPALLKEIGTALSLTLPRP